MRRLIKLISLAGFLCIAGGAEPTPTPVRRLLFEPAEQAGAFIARGPGYSLRFTSAGIDLNAANSPLVRLSFAGSRLVAARPEGESVAKTHYFLGNDRDKWRTDVPNFGRVRYAGIYPGIDLVAYGSQGTFEYDLEVAPFADPSKIRMQVQGTKDVSLNAEGDLVLGKTPFRLRKPRVTQEGHEVKGKFNIRAGGLVGFELGAYNRAKPLVIDPIITFLTYLGGNWGEQGNDITVDKDGNVYVAGTTFSDAFPGPVVFGATPFERQFAFLAKYEPVVGGKTRLLFTVVLGDNADVSAFTVGTGVAVDPSGNIILIGNTNTIRFPLMNAVQQAVAGGNDCLASGNRAIRCADAFLMKFAPDGRTLIFSTFYGGPQPNGFERVATDAAGGIYALGSANSGMSATATPDALQPLGKPGSTDIHLARFSPAGQVVYATYLGGALIDTAAAIAVESPGVVWIGGETFSSDITTTTGAYQTTFAALRRAAYVARIDMTRAGAAGLTYASYFGRAGGNSTVTQILLDAAGQAVFCGSTYAGIPATTPTAMQSGASGGPINPSTPQDFLLGDAFIARIDRQLTGTAQLTYSSYVGGTGFDSGTGCAVDGNGNFLVTGTTGSVAPFITPGSPLPFGTATTLSHPYVIRINPAVAGGRLESIIFGGTNTDLVMSMAVDTGRKFAYLTGQTFSQQFPVSSQATQKTYGGNTTTTAGGATVAALGGLGDGWLAQLDLTSPQVAPTALGLHAGDYQFVNPGATLAINPAVRLVDANGNPVPLAGYPVTYSGTNVAVLTTSALTDSEGISGNIVRIPNEGPATLTARIDGIPTPYTFHFKAISGGLATGAAILSGAGQSGKAGTQLAAPLVVELRNANNQPFPFAGITVQFKVDNVTVSAATVETDSLGRASTNVTLGTKPGPMKVTVIVGAFPEMTATFSATGPVISAAGVVNAATFVGGSVSPGLIVTIFGDRIGPAALAVGSGASGKFPVLLSETRVLFDGVAAPLVYVSAGQTSAIVPYSVAGKASTQVVVEYQGTASNAATVPVVAARPGLFSSNSSGSGQGALLNEDNSVNSAANPIARRKIAVLFATGEGETEPAGVDGQLANAVYPKPKLAVRVRIGGVEAEVLYAGAAPTLVAGVLQVNVRIPPGTPDGNAVVELFVGDAQSPATITIAVKGD